MTECEQVRVQGYADDGEGTADRPREHIPQQGGRRNGLRLYGARDHTHLLLGKGYWQ